jgi:hypothetical protein
MMQPQIQQPKHLTEDELDELLMGCAPSDSLAHVEHCALCAGQLAEFDSSLSAFNHAASAWSEAKSNALTRDLNLHRTPFRITARAAWSCASIVVLVAAASLGFGMHEHSAQIASQQIAVYQGNGHWNRSPANPSVGFPHAPCAQREIASDDAMLREIDSAINTAEPSPEELYGITDNSGASRQDSRRPQVKD